MGKLQVNGGVIASDTVKAGNGTISMQTEGSLLTTLSATGGWARGWYYNINNTLNPCFGMYGGASAVNWFFVGTSHSNTWMKVEPNGTVTATKFIGSLDGNASTASLLSIHNSITNTSTRSTAASGWDGGVSGLQYVWGQSFKDTSIGSDTGDLVLGLRKGQYTSGGTELCMMIDGDYYSLGKKVLHAGNYTDYAPTKTGSGASGTWSINIGGNASTASKLSAARTFTVGNSSKSFDGSGNVSWTLAEMGASDRYLLLYNSKEIWIDGDANTYYPVYVNMGHGGMLYGWETLSISRRYNDSAPNSWNTSTHRGGLTFTLRWSGDAGWGGNDHNIIVEEFSETYSTMVGGMTLSVDGLIVWLRGGGARYYLSSPYGFAAYATIYYDGYTAGDGRTYSARSYNADTVASEIHSKWLVRPWGTFAGTASNADTIDGHHFHWDGKGGQPTWLWGANDYGNSYVYNPSNFSVNYANSAGTANYAHYLNTVAGNEIRIHNATGLTNGGSLWLGWAWADGSKTVTKDWYIGNFSGGGLANVYASTFNGTLNGNATTTSYPAGFVQRASTSSWGAVQSGLITEWDAGPNSNKGAVAFLAYPSANEVSVKIDGYFFQNEGNNRVLDIGDVAVDTAAAWLNTSGWYKVATVTKRDNGNTGPLSVLLVLGKNYSYSTSDMFTILVQGGYYNSQFIPLGHCDNGTDVYTQIRSTGDGAGISFDIEVYLNTPSGGNTFYVKAIALEGSVVCHAFTSPSGSVMKSQSIQFTTHGGSYGSTDPASNPSAIPGYGEAGAIYYKI